MLKDGVTFSNQVISLLVDDKSYSKESSTLSKLYCLLVGSDVQSNDSTCFILEFSDEIWVVPNNLVETNKLKAWTEDLEQQWITGGITLAIVKDSYNKAFGATHYTIAPDYDTPLQMFKLKLSQLINSLDVENVSGNW